MTGTGNFGIRATNSGTNLTISAAGVSGGQRGISAQNFGTGALGITATGDVTGTIDRGIEAVNFGTEALSITATGDVVGTSSIGIIARNLGTDLTISAAGVTGAAGGIRARNYGSGALSITATGDVAGTTGFRIYASNVSGTNFTVSAAGVNGGHNGIFAINSGTDLTIEAGGVTGGYRGINAGNYGTGTLAITRTGEVVGGVSTGILALSANDARVDIAGLVSGGSGTAIDMTGVDGDATLALRPGWGLDGQALGSAGVGDQLELTGTGASALDLARLGDAAGPDAIPGFETFLKDGASDWTLTNTQSDGGFLAAELRAGGLILQDAAFVMDPAGTGLFDIAAAGSLGVLGMSAVAGSLQNAGIISMRNGVATYVLTVTGDYSGAGGSLMIDTVLGDDSSASDVLVVGGDVTGETAPFVNNAGGTGGQTVNGIVVVDVAGSSTADAFVLGSWDFTTTHGERALIGGAFGYVLRPMGEDWVLSSQLRPVPVDPVDPPVTPVPPGPPGPPVPPVPPDPPAPPVPPDTILQPGVPVFEVFGHIGGSLLNMPSLQQRSTGAVRSGEGAVQVSRGVFADGGWSVPTGLVARIEGRRDSTDPVASTASASFDRDVFSLDLGITRELGGLVGGAPAGGELVGGLHLRHATAVAEIASPFGAGRIEAAGLGLGGSLTWYLPEGLYVDAQAMAMWLESDLSLQPLGGLADGVPGFGYGLSVELGKVIAVSDAWTVTPQAQLGYSRTALEAFTDGFGVRVTPEDVQSRQIRLGVTADYEDRWTSAAGGVQGSLIGIGFDLIHEGFPETVVDVAGTPVISRLDDLRGEITLRSSYSWQDDRFSVFGEVAAGTGLNAPGDSDSLRYAVGFRTQC